MSWLRQTGRHRETDSQTDIQTETEIEGAEIHRTIRVAVMSWLRERERERERVRNTNILFNKAIAPFERCRAQ